MKTKLKNTKGFTIIEVLIVLAIAGLIMLIVFLAVPALQRNSRNTQRKNDVAGILAAMAEYSNNNNGQLPNECSTGAGNPNPIRFSDSAVATETQSEAKVGYYNRGACAQGAGMPADVGRALIRTGAFAAIAAGTLDAATEDYLVIQPGGSCVPNTNASAAGSARGIAAVYLIETGSNVYSQVCQES